MGRRAGPENWFHALKGALAKRNRDAKTAAQNAAQPGNYRSHQPEIRGRGDHMTVVPLDRHRHEQLGYYSLADVPQQPSVAEIAISTGWWELDQIWKPYPGQFNVVTGIAGHGKSTFLLNVLCNLAKKHGTKSFLYVPENESASARQDEHDLGRRGRVRRVLPIGLLRAIRRAERLRGARTRWNGCSTRPSSRSIRTTPTSC
jgi:hypothetical protein